MKYKSFYHFFYRDIFKMLLWCLTLLCFWVIRSEASESGDYDSTKMCYENFLKCELTRTDADDHFNGRPFKIIMINLFDVGKEGDIRIFTGAVNCWVVDKYEKIFVALGVRKILDNEQVSYYVARKENFSITATELINYPYKERCRWTQYWLDLN